MKFKKHEVLIEDKTFLPFWLVGSATISAIVYSLIYAFTGYREPTLFFLIFILLASFLLAVISDIITYLNQGKPKDLWKLGWLGVLGGLSLWVWPMVFFYVFFAFFGLKRK